MSRPREATSVATRTAALGLAALTTPLIIQAAPKAAFQNQSDFDAWFNFLTGKHKMVFDAVSSNEGLPIVYAYNFLSTNNQTGTPDDELSVLVVLRGKAIPVAMDDNAWNKFKLGKMFKIIDYATNSPSDRNLYWNPKDGEMPQPGMHTRRQNLNARQNTCCSFFPNSTSIPVANYVSQATRNENSSGHME